MKALPFPTQRALSASQTKARLPRAPLVVMGLGATLMLGHGFVQDYAQAIASPDGLYIPDARHVVPEGTPPGKYSHTFRIYNARPWMTSFEAHADCSCTGLSWEKMTIFPFGWKDINASMSLAKKRQSKSVTVSISTKSHQKTYLFAYMRSEKGE